MTKSVESVIFDVDGTLVDSNDAHAYAWVEAMQGHGYHVLFGKVRPLIGMGGDKVLPQTIGVTKDSPIGQQIDSRRQQIFKERYLPTLQAFPCAKELLEHMHHQGLKLAIASSSKPAELDNLLQVIEPHVKDLFSQVTTSQDVSQSKPDPDIVQATLQRMRLGANEVMMIGDTPYDIESAWYTGVKTIAFRCGGWNDQDLQGAIAIYNNPADLLIHYNMSPLVTHP
jgi:HAD superfamily hydrolase (TIGR01549 family)